MTVDRFLRQGGPNRQKKNSRAPLLAGLVLPSRNSDRSNVNYLKLRSRTVVRNWSPESGSYSDGTSSKHQERKQKRTFKERIHQAAIASGVKPINVLVQPKDTPLSKPPLSFQLVSPPRSRRIRGSIMAPNRKNNPFQDLRFSHTLDPSKPKFPLSRWHTTFLHHLKICYQESGTKEAGAAQLTSKPLHFVPLLQAEEGYKALFVQVQQ